MTSVRMERRVRERVNCAIGVGTWKSEKRCGNSNVETERGVLLYLYGVRGVGSGRRRGCGGVVRGCWS